MSLFLEDQEVKDLCILIGNAEDILIVARRRTNDLFLDELIKSLHLINNWIQNKSTAAKQYNKGWKDSQKKEKTIFGP